MNFRIANSVSYIRHTFILVPPAIVFSVFVMQRIFHSQIPRARLENDPAVLKSAATDIHKAD